MGCFCSSCFAVSFQVAVRLECPELEVEGSHPPPLHMQTQAPARKHFASRLASTTSPPNSLGIRSDHSRGCSRCIGIVADGTLGWFFFVFFLSFREISVVKESKERKEKRKRGWARQI